MSTAAEHRALRDEVKALRASRAFLSEQLNEARAENTRLRAAAPAVEGWVRCEALGAPQCHYVGRLYRGTDTCPGPHRSLLLGPEVTA